MTHQDVIFHSCYNGVASLHPVNMVARFLLPRGSHVGRRSERIDRCPPKKGEEEEGGGACVIYEKLRSIRQF